MTELFAPSLADQIACVKREIGKRRAAYWRFVANKHSRNHMTQAKADREIATMEAVLQTLEELQLGKTMLEGAMTRRQ
jgi:hypothetical protein